MTTQVTIDCFPESARRYNDDHLIVVVDVIRATTTACTAVALGHRVYPVKTTDEAFTMASRLDDPLLVGELGGNMPFGFHFTNSPAQVELMLEEGRPVILLSSSGTQLLLNAVGAQEVITGCLRNWQAVAEHLAGYRGKVAVLGAGTRGVFRIEDQIGCAWIAEKLVNDGFLPSDERTEQVIQRWSGADPAIIKTSDSARYLEATGQNQDLDFVLTHINDLDTVPLLTGDHLVPAHRERLSPDKHGSESPSIGKTA